MAPSWQRKQWQCSKLGQDSPFCNWSLLNETVANLTRLSFLTLYLSFLFFNVSISHLLRSSFWERSFRQSGGVRGISANESQSSKPKSYSRPNPHPALCWKKSVSCFKTCPVQGSEYLQKTGVLVMMLEVKSRPAVNRLHLQKQCNYHWLITSVYQGRRIVKEYHWRESRWWLRREGCVCNTKIQRLHQAGESYVYGCCETLILIFPLLTNCLRVNLVSAIIVVEKKASQENMQV